MDLERIGTAVRERVHRMNEAAALAEVEQSLRGSEPAEAGRRFETLFASMLVKELRGSLPNGLFGGGPGADTYEAWFDEHLGGSIAEAGALGLGDLVEDWLARAIVAREDEA